jgi:hypothetical protein
VSTENNLDNEHQINYNDEPIPILKQPTEIVSPIEEPVPVMESSIASTPPKLRIKQQTQVNSYHEELENKVNSSRYSLNQSHERKQPKSYGVLAIPIIGWLLMVGAYLIWDKFPLSFIRHYSVTKRGVSDFYTVNMLGCIMIIIGLALIIIGIKKVIEEFLFSNN